MFIYGCSYEPVYVGQVERIKQSDIPDYQIIYIRGTPTPVPRSKSEILPGEKIYRNFFGNLFSAGVTPDAK